ncbi:S1 family peptidase [Streptomyces sp. NPDC101150]|uniref:S1 family peptidase n=1 Tax=Streptomyces sp. NPDC101150 TaxID=3366114 RepID=UPI00380A500B
MTRGTKLKSAVKRARYAPVAVAATMLVGAMTGTAGAAPVPGPGDDSPKIIGGGAAPAYSFMAAIHGGWGDAKAFTCGGGLIRGDWVVTAAHCVSKPGKDGKTEVIPAKDFTVRVGSKDRTIGGTVVGVRSITVHPDHVASDNRNYGNDLALLHLTKKVPQAPVAMSPDATPAGTAVREIGWGYTKPDDKGQDKLPRALQQLDTKTIPADTPECVKGPDGDDSWGIHKGDVCADNPTGTFGPCGGDSGSPLLKKVAGRWVIVGVDSRGVGHVCGESPDIYTEIHYFKDWVAKTIG